MTTQPEQEPTNSDIMAKLVEIDKELKRVKKQINTNSWSWLYFIGLVGLFWWLSDLLGC